MISISSRVVFSFPSLSSIDEGVSTLFILSICFLNSQKVPECILLSDCKFLAFFIMTLALCSLISCSIISSIFLSCRFLFLSGHSLLLLTFFLRFIIFLTIFNGMSLGAFFYFTRNVHYSLHFF